MIFNKFKKLWLMGLSLILILPLTDCTDFMHGKPKKLDFIEIKKENLACLKNVSTNLGHLLKAQSSEAQIDETFNCLDATLLEFQNRVQGSQDANSFSSDDLFQVFNEFLSDAKISQEATADILRLKSGLLGGADQKLTKLEITQLRDLLKVIHPEIIRLMPFTAIFSFKKGNKEFSKESIKLAFDQLGSSLNAVLAATQLVRSDYQFEDFKKLLSNLHFFESKSTDFFNLAGEIKNLLAGSEGVQTAADFKGFIFSITEILRLYTLHNQNYVTFEIHNAGQLEDTITFTEDILNMLENTLQYKKAKVIFSDSLDPLISLLADQDILPVRISANTLVSFYKLILVRVFQAGPEIDFESFDGLRKIHFVNIRRELTIFKTYLSFINSLPFSNLKGDQTTQRFEIATVQKSLLNYDFAKSPQLKNISDSAEQSLILEAVNEYRNEFLAARPVVYRFNKMVIAANQEIWDQNWQDLVRGLYVKFLARQLVIGWGNGNETRRVQSAVITEAGLIKWYAEFKPFGIEAKIFDPRAINSGAKSFKEANLFPYSADGNNQMSSIESIQYLNILSTGGGIVFNDFKEGFKKANCNLTEKDVFGFFWNQESCAYADFKLNYKYYFSNLSYLVAYLNHLSEPEFLSFYEEAMGVARVTASTKGRLESADIRNFIILMHYMESFYAQFDIDRNSALSATELRSAYPRFKTFARDFAYNTSKDKIDLFNSAAVQAIGYSCYSEEDLIRESFIYLVYHGEVPGIMDLNVAPCLRGRSLIDFSGEVDRKTIINTFKILKGVLGS